LACKPRRLTRRGRSAREGANALKSYGIDDGDGEPWQLRDWSVRAVRVWALCGTAQAWLESDGVAPPVKADLIEKELTAYHEWQEAFLRGDEKLPSLPASEATARLPVVIGALAARAVLILLAELSRRFGLSSLQIWTARRVVDLDRFALEPASCSLNNAYTRLGLAMLAAGDELGAIHCLRKSWHVHPCPHNTSFGLSPALWRALAGTSGTTAVRAEYEQMARRFYWQFQWPSPRLSWKDFVRSLTARWS
jgi:hypothetical protein